MKMFYHLATSLLPNVVFSETKLLLSYPNAFDFSFF